ncbi:lipopolysaccharide biosynthesis protein [Neobacillus sp. BF23-41]|uniref:lipopolysaccharide biosynthesis protein n=1 Tax=Neobacillus sp. BF23-41 TaxID=3240280 RepID=UPI0034E551BE
MRVKNSIYNILAGIGSQIIITLLSFISRSVFVNYLGAEYLGVNGLFSNILGMLSLAEAGIGSAIIYNLYKPVAEGNKERINILMQFYKKAYMVIALVVLLLGLSLLPFLKYFIKDSTVDNIGLIYVIFLLNTASSYLFSYKISFLNVCQKGYIVTGVYSLSSILATCIKIGILYATNNYILYLVIDILITIITSIILTFIANKMYPLLRNKGSGKLDEETRSNIVKNVKALILHNIGGYAVFGTDNIVIASFVSVKAVGLYSNYYMLINICRTFINQFFDNITHSVGNLVAEENEEKLFTIFKVTMLINFWIYSFFTIFLYIIMEPFITFWLGSDFIMGKSILIILMINFFVSGMRRSISIVKTTSGIFQEDRFAPFFEAAINLGASIILVNYIGITGVFIGTLISTLFVPFWIAPYLVYKKVFKRSVFYYFLKYTYFVLIGLGTCLLTNLICNFLFSDGILSLLLKGTVCFIIPNTIYIAIFHRTNEFKYISDIFKSILEKLLKQSRFKKGRLSA